MKNVTLDALIPREDFEIIDELENSNISRNKSTLSIEDLSFDSFFFSALRKPDFQRETNEWSPEKICGFIESFVKGELVPAIILWKHKNGYIFVIDGSHRLSALGAWINDDYGDNDISLNYYEKFIPQEQKEIAEYTRKLVNEKIGSFKDYQRARRNSEGIPQYILDNVKNLGAIALQIQWVEGDSTTAEKSFLKINQSATPISNAELELIQSRRMPYAIAARAIMRAGKGHNYWSIFDSEVQKNIKNIAGNIHQILFSGDNFSESSNLSNLPIGGNFASTSTLDLINQTVKISNNIDEKTDYEVDNDGSKTFKYLKNTLELLQLVHSKEKFSLGLHPFVYFYSNIGKHKIASYYGILELFYRLKTQKKISEFCKVRYKFEQILLKYEFLIQQIVRKWRQSKRGYKEVADYFEQIITLLNQTPNAPIETIIDDLVKISKFNYLKIAIIDNTSNPTNRKDFSRGEKFQIKVNTLIKGIPLCPICNGYIDMNSSSIDHIQRKRDGGIAEINNGQVTHIYCNTTLKN